MSLLTVKISVYAHRYSSAYRVAFGLQYRQIRLIVKKAYLKVSEGNGRLHERDKLRLAAYHSAARHA